MKSGWQIESLIASVLRKDGYEIFVLLPNYNPIAQKIFQSTGQTKFIYFDDLPGSDKKNVNIYKAKKTLKNKGKLAKLLNFQENGIRIGKNVLSLALRRMRTGSLNLKNKIHYNEVKNGLMISFESIIKSSILLKRIKPDLVVFNERGYSPAGELFDSCIKKRIKTVQWCGAPQSDCLLFKKFCKLNHESHPHSLDKKSWYNIRKKHFSDRDQKKIISEISNHYKEKTWFHRQKLQEGKNIYDKRETLIQLGISPNKKVAVIFCHILYDATFFYGRSLFPTYEKWLVETVRYAQKNENLQWIIKVHPANLWRSKIDGKPLEQLELTILKKEFGNLPDHIKTMPADTAVNTFSLFQAIDYGLTVRGTIGMELPCWGIPVVTAGTGRYDSLGFTLDPKNRRDYKRIILNLHKYPRLSKKTILLAKKHAHAVFLMRPFPISSFHIDYENSNIKLSKNVIANKKIEKDLHTVSNWIGLSNNEDLLNVPNIAKY